MFRNRKEAGEKLAKALGKYKNKNVLVFAIPRGGIEVAYEVAKYLRANFSLLISRKLPLPHNKEVGFGAMAENGSSFIFDWAKQELSESEIKRIKKEQRKEIKRRIEVLRNGKPLPKISGKIVILIDDGLAMGATMEASIMLCKKKKARKIIVAVPVSGTEIAEKIEEEVDELIILEKPVFFQAVAQVYESWHDISDEEVLMIMEKWKRRR